MTSGTVKWRVTSCIVMSATDSKQCENEDSIYEICAKSHIEIASSNRLLGTVECE
jgi:hypothetical protein